MVISNRFLNNFLEYSRVRISRAPSAYRAAQVIREETGKEKRVMGLPESGFVPVQVREGSTHMGRHQGLRGETCKRLLAPDS